MIWIKLKNKDAGKAVVYTTDPDMAEQLEMFQRRKGKYYYKVVSAKWFKKGLGFTPKVNRGKYMSMVHMYPPAADYIKKREKIPDEVKAAMEKHMEWDGKDFNPNKRLDLAEWEKNEKS